MLRKKQEALWLIRDDVRDVVAGIRLSPVATMRKIKQNLFWAFVYNGIGIPDSGPGILESHHSGGGNGAEFSFRGNEFWPCLRG